MKENQTTALAVLTPIDIESIPDVGHEAISDLEDERLKIRRSNRLAMYGSGASAAGVGLGAVVGSLTSFGALLIVVGFAGLAGGAALFGWNVLRLVRHNTTRRMYRRAFDGNAAAMEGGIRLAAARWNEGYEAARACLEEVDRDTPPKTLARIARAVAELEETRRLIDARIEALHRRRALPAPPDDTDP